MEILLRVKNLSVSFRNHRGVLQAVRNISFEVGRGEIVALVGESGCGKSVTAKSIMGLVKKKGRFSPDSVIQFEGKDLAQFSTRQWNSLRGKECTMVFQDALAALNPTQKIGKQVAEVLKNHFPAMTQAQCREKVLNIFSRMGIPDAEACYKKYPNEISGGQRQRIVIAMAMIAEPKLLIADEPTTSLDVTIQAQILELMKQLQKEFNTSVLLITHDLGIVADFADRIVVMYAGKIVETGSLHDIFYKPRHPYTKALLASVPKPDTERKCLLDAIPGTVPDMTAPPPGCSFYPRCPCAMNICSRAEPVLAECDKGHCAACWLMNVQKGGE